MLAFRVARGHHNAACARSRATGAGGMETASRALTTAVASGALKQQQHHHHLHTLLMGSNRLVQNAQQLPCRKLVRPLLLFNRTSVGLFHSNSKSIRQLAAGPGGLSWLECLRSLWAPVRYAQSGCHDRFLDSAQPREGSGPSRRGLETALTMPWKEFQSRLSSWVFTAGGHIPRGFEKFFPEMQDRKTSHEGSETAESERNGKPTPRKSSEGEEKEDEKEGETDRPSSASGTSKTSSKSKTSEKREKGEPDSGIPSANMGAPIFFAFILFLVLRHLAHPAWPGFGNAEITMKEFLSDMVAPGYVNQVEVVNRERVRVFLQDNETAQIPEDLKQRISPKGGHFCFRIPSPEAFEQRLETFQLSQGVAPADLIAVKHVSERSVFEEVYQHVPAILIFLFGALGVRVALSSALRNSDAPKVLRMRRANVMSQKDVKVRVKFSDVAGMRDVKKEITEFVDFLKDPKRFVDMGVKMPKGALLVGTPGTGKTLLAKAIAGEAKVPFFSISGSEFIEVFVGIGASRVRDLFARARASAPSIIFIDEIDVIGRKRGRPSSHGGSEERESTLMQLLVEMDGFSTATGVVVLAGTNRADVLDPALLRPGRFDRVVQVEKPDIVERSEIFKVHLKPLKLDASLDIPQISRRLAALSTGAVGADIQNICNEAGILAVRRDSPTVTMEDFENACDKVFTGLRRTDPMFTEEVKRTVAYHEAGHAVVAWFLKYASPIMKVSIVPRSSGALGFAQTFGAERPLAPRQQILDSIAVLLGGRVSEEHFLGTASTGAVDDLTKTTKLAYSYVTQLGFSPKAGLLSFPVSDEAFTQRIYSEGTAQSFDREARDLVQEQYTRVQQLVDEKKELIQSLATHLIEREVVTFTDLVDILGPRPFPIDTQFEQYLGASSPPAVGTSTCEGSDGTSPTSVLPGRHTSMEEEYLPSLDPSSSASSFKDEKLDAKQVGAVLPDEPQPRNTLRSS